MPGDLVLVAGTHAYDRVIARATGSRWTHCGLMVNAVTLVESTSRGIHVTPLVDYRARSDLTLRVVDTGLAPDRRADAVRYARSRVAQEYGFFSVLSVWLSLSTGGRVPLTISLTDSDTCSELCAWSLFHAGLDLPKHPSLMTPKDVARLVGVGG